MKAQVRERLIQVARAGDTLTYRALGESIGIDVDSLVERTELSHLLTEIAREEHDAGRPLLTAVVVDDQGRPGYEFFSVADELGFEVGAYDMPFFEATLDRVYDYWQAHNTGE